MDITASRRFRAANAEIELPFPSIYHLIASQSSLQPDAVAIVSPGKAPLTYAALHARVDDGIAVLKAAGVRPSDRVALAAPNGPACAEAFVVVAAYAVCVPLNLSYQETELAAYLSVAHVSTLVVPAGSDSIAASIARAHGLRILELAPEWGTAPGIFTAVSHERAFDGPDVLAGGDDVAVVMLTSGTTARPKIVPLTHRNICASVASTRAALALEPRDRCLNLASLAHIHGLCMVLASFAAGASVVCPPDLSAPHFFDWLDECAPTWYVASPAVHQAILVQASLHRDVIERRRLRLIRSGAAPLSAQLLHDLERTFEAPVIEAYGMTETSPLIACNPLPPRLRKVNSVGLPAGTEIAVVDPIGHPLPLGREGEVVVRGANVMAGYEGDDAANDEAFVDGREWFRTGDQGYLDADGYLFLTGRLKEMINRGGQKIAPKEVDEALLEHPAVEQAVAFAVPHATLGEEVAAVVVLRADASTTEQELRTFISTRLAAFKTPRRILIRDSLPVGTTGKVRRIGLAADLGVDLAASMPTTTAPNALERRVIALWQRVLDVSRIDINDDFFDLGGNSLLAATLFEAIAAEFGWWLPLGSLQEGATVAYLSTLLHQQEQGIAAPTLVALQPHGSLPPLFCAHPMDGSVVHYRLLARYLGPNQPVYGLQGRAAASSRPLQTAVEDMAADHVRTIRTHQLEGPYYLAGYSAGGILAFEIAQQLREQGQTVAFLGLFDTLCPGAGLPAPLSFMARRRLIEKIRYHSALYATLPPEARGAFIGARTRDVVALLSSLVRTYWRSSSVSSPESQTVVPEALWLPYTPRAYAGPVDFFWSSHTFSASLGEDDPRLGWRPLVSSGLNVHRIPGNHHAVMIEPAVVRQVARRVHTCLDDARNRPPTAAPALTVVKMFSATV